MENSFEEVPILRAHGQESAEPEFGTAGVIDVKGGEITIATGGDVETQAGLRVEG
jgi:hypothetical protein